MASPHEANSGEENMRDHQDKIVKWHEQETKLAGWVAAFSILSFGLYFVYFGFRNFTLGDPNSWGDFGDYFGGVVNPIIGIVTVILVVRTLQATRAESELTRDEMKTQTALFVAQLEHYGREQKLAELHKRLDGALYAWNLAVAKEYEYLDLMLLGEQTGSAPKRLDAILNRSALLTHLENMKSKTNWNAVSDSWVTLLDECANLLREMGQYCADYDAVAGNRILSDFYRRRVNLAMRIMTVVGLVGDATREQLAVGRLQFADAS
jgi:hypothetical protein